MRQKWQLSNTDENLYDKKAKLCGWDAKPWRKAKYWKEDLISYLYNDAVITDIFNRVMKTRKIVLRNSHCLCLIFLFSYGTKFMAIII